MLIKLVHFVHIQRHTKEITSPSLDSYSPQATSLDTYSQNTLSDYSATQPVSDYSASQPVATSASPYYKQKMVAMMGDLVKSMVTSMVTTAMESNSARLAMVVSGIVFTQTSVLNYVYFLDSVRRLLGAG